MPNYHRTDDECREFLGKRRSHYHRVRLNDNVTTPGVVDRNHEFPYLGLTADDFAEKSVLDIGALDGVLSFNAERLGATNVVAIDVEDMADYDWGFDGPTQKFLGKGDTKNRTFRRLKRFFESDVRRKKKTVYRLNPDKDGLFDIVFFYGVLYHLRHPLLAFNSIRKVCRGAVCVETHVCNVDPQIPQALFYLDDVLDEADTNWTGPTEACVVSWMRDAGFKDVWAEKTPRMKSRQRFVGFVDAPTFAIDTDNFFRCDDEYFARSRDAVTQQLKVGSFGERPK